MTKVITLKGTNMQATDRDLKEIADSLHLKEMLLRELTSNVQDRLGNIKALRERVQKEFNTATRAARKE